MYHVLGQYEGKLAMYQNLCDKITRDPKKEKDYADNWKCSPPYSSFAHYSGKKKPWIQKFNYLQINSTLSLNMFGVLRYWFKELEEINNKYNMGIDVEHWNEKHWKDFKQLPLGELATYKDSMDIIFQNGTKATV